MNKTLSKEALYLQLQRLVLDMPDLYSEPTPETYEWLGKAGALIKATGDTVGYATLVTCARNLHGALHQTNAETIYAIVHGALGAAELAAPAGQRGSFIAAGKTLDAFAAVGKVVDTVGSDVLFVDPYADEKILTEYAVLAPEGVALRVLAGDKSCKPSLKPAAMRWMQQYSDARPLEVRLAPANTLHDRLILVDGSTAWVLGQSFNKLAERAHTSISRLDPELSAMKISAYADIWAGAKSI